MSTTSVLRPARTSRPRLTARGLLRLLVHADARHRAAVHFSRLDEHLMRDIGIGRGDADAELRRIRQR